MTQMSQLRSQRLCCSLTQQSFHFKSVCGTRSINRVTKALNDGIEFDDSDFREYTAYEV